MRAIRNKDMQCCRTTSAVLMGLVLLLLGVYGAAELYARSTGPRATAAGPGSDNRRFTDARRQSAEFIGYDRSIVLTPEQKKIMDDALGSIPAPCCKQYSIATCCCPCNLARSVWGLSKLLITSEHATVSAVNAAAREWLQFTNPAGYTGDACFTGGCDRAFERNGCGGMDGSHHEQGRNLFN